MKLQTKINDDLKQAITVRDKDRSNLLKVIVAELSRYSTKEVSDEDVLKKLKMMKEGAIACNNTYELGIIESYMPTMMSEQGVKDFVTLIIETAHLTEMKQVMQHIQQSPLAKTIDNKIASKFAKEILSNLK